MYRRKNTKLNIHPYYDNNKISLVLMLFWETIHDNGKDVDRIYSVLKPSADGIQP